MLYLGSSVSGIYTECRANGCCVLGYWAIAVAIATIGTVAIGAVNIAYQLL